MRHLFAYLRRCRHTPRSGWAGGTPYGDLQYIGTDGTGVEHARVVVPCGRCGTALTVAKVHLPATPRRTEP